MKMSRLSAVLLAGTAVFVTTGTGSSLPASLNPAELLKGAGTFHVEVEQRFGNAGDLYLPYAETVTALLQASGLTAASAETAALRVRVHAEARALSRRYQDPRQTEAMTQYSGAEIEGTYQFNTNDGRKSIVGFSGRRETPVNITRLYEDQSAAPFGAAFDGFVESFTRTVAESYGATPMISVMRAPDSDDFFYVVPQLQRCAAEELARIGGPDTKSVLLEALQSVSPHRQAGAARGLRLLGDGSVGPALIATLNVIEGELPEDLSADPRWQTLTHHERAFDSASDDAGFLEPGPEILGAVRALDFADKTRLLFSTLQNQDYALARVGAALLLGASREAIAFEKLIGIAQNDPHLLVRTAALNALGEMRDPRSVPVLRSLARKPGDGPEKSAARRALDLIGGDTSTLAGNTAN